MLTYRWNAIVGGSNVAQNGAKTLRPYGFHVTNVLLHAIVSALVVLLAAPFLGSDNTAAAVAGALFAVQPIHADAVASIVGRAELLSALFTLLSLLSFQHSCARASGRVGGFVLLLLAAALGVLAMLCKEQGITALPLCSACDLLFVCGMDVNALLQKLSGGGAGAGKKAVAGKAASADKKAAKASTVYTIPEGAEAGQKLTVELPGGPSFAFECPAGVVAGQKINVQLPAQPAAHEDNEGGDGDGGKGEAEGEAGAAAVFPLLGSAGGAGALAVRQLVLVGTSLGALYARLSLGKPTVFAFVDNPAAFADTLAARVLTKVRQSGRGGARVRVGVGE